MGSTGDLTLKLMIFLSGLVIIAILIALESPGIHSIYSGINSGVSKSGMSLLVDKINDIYDKYYMWSLNHDEEHDRFDYTTQVSVVLSPGLYLIYPDKDGYYRIDYYSEANIDVYRLSTTAIDSPEKFNQFIKNSEMVTSMYLGFNQKDFTILGVCKVDAVRTKALIILNDKINRKILFTLKVVKPGEDACDGGTKHQLEIIVKNADSVITTIYYNALESPEGG